MPDADRRFSKNADDRCAKVVLSRFGRHVVLGTAVAHAVVMLFVMLLLLLPLSLRPGGGGGGIGSGTGTASHGRGSGSGKTGTGGADRGEQTPDASSYARTSSAAKSKTAAEHSGAPQPTPEAVPPPREQPEPPPEPKKSPTETPEEREAFAINPVDSLMNDGGGDGFEGEAGTSEFMGVKVKGSIALVCDISGSMTQDFPALYRGLRKSFPKSTPLILVRGCSFNPPIPNAPPPRKGVDQYSLVNAPGLKDDPYVYMAQSTTDAIIYAVETLRRRTVMFNNDLQDGGSEAAIRAFDELHAKLPFTLSGRSLNCDAPHCLRDFIERSGGDFKVDTIHRGRAPATVWRP